MKSDGDSGPQADLGAVRWLSIHDDLLRALAHAISNGMATVTATATLLEHGIMPEPRIARGLTADAERLELLLQALRHLPRRVEAAAEPMLLTDALDGAKVLLQEHPDLRDRTISVESRGDVQPVRAEPGAVLHACAVAVLTGARYTPAAGTVRVTLETDGDVVRLVAAGDDGPHYGAEELREQDTRAIAWLLADHGGRAESHASGCAFTLPTLQSTRRAPR
jgi:signal transduction histidine kinase